MPRVIPPVLFGLLLFACADRDHVIGRGPLAKADLIGNCTADTCGGKSTGNCWCDDACAENGDCCTNKEEVCDEPVDACQAGHEACTAGEAGCWEFSDDGLPVSGPFRPECDELATDCGAGVTCVIPPCPLDAPCPGLCIEASCLPDPCQAGHEACTAGDSNCWEFVDDRLPVSGSFRPECDDSDTDCGAGVTCVVPPCGLDAPCPGLCVEASCLAGS